MDAGFAIILAIVLLAAAGFGLLQHRTYQRAVCRMATEHSDERGSFLVSGRGKGWSRGVVALLVVDTSTEDVTAAEAMVGASVFARFTPRAELLGPMTGIADRASDRHLKLAVMQASEQYRLMRKQRTPRRTPSRAGQQ